MRLKYLALAVLAVPAAPAAAQDTPVIVVTGQGLEQTPATPAYDVIELDRDTIVSGSSGRIEDVLLNVAGFQQFRRSDSRSSNPSAQGATLRALGGNATSRALVLLDAVPMLDPFFGYVPFSAIAPERLESIRVTRGGGSGPFGSGALAGAIELDSADAATMGLLSWRGGDQRPRRDRAVGHRRARARRRLRDGQRAVRPRQGLLDHARGAAGAGERARGVHSWSASARLVQPLADNIEVQLRGMTFDDERVLRFRGAETTSQGQDLSARLVSRGPWQVDALVYGQWRNFTNIVISSTTFNKSLDQKDTPSSGLGGKLEVRPPVGGGHTLRFGSDYRKSEGDLAEDAFNATTGALTAQRFAGGANSDLGFFVEDDWSSARSR
jgi:outer membrane receptor protein involved in Fe transport